MPECLQNREKGTTNNLRPATKKPGQKRERERIKERIGDVLERERK